MKATIKILIEKTMQRQFIYNRYFRVLKSPEEFKNCQILICDFTFGLNPYLHGRQKICSRNYTYMVCQSDVVAYMQSKMHCLYKANKIRNATMRQNNPIASDKANPRIAYENSCCFKEGFLAYPIIRLPKTVPIPAPDPATPTVAAPAPINLAAVSMSF